MEGLCGKGIWLAHSYDIQRAVEMATKIDAAYLLIKTGHGPYFFPESARLLLQRARSLGFHPLAWIQLTPKAPQEALVAIERTLQLGYEGLVLFLDSQGLAPADTLAPLVASLEKADIPLSRLALATPPPEMLPDRTALEMLAPLCRGGWMPLCFPSWGKPAEVVIDKGVYQALSDLSLTWGTTPEVYPVLAPLPPASRETPFLPEDLIPWLESMLRHGVDFFSVFHADIAEKALWPILASTVLPCQSQAVPLTQRNDTGVVVPQPVYISASASDTVWGLINRHSMKREIFWEWNGHLWDSRGLPRDPDYLQAGWRIRVK
ncbi:MAG: hypothetical protein JXB35_16315 [Anaerolineae bacterium]|nr:hypothetical protein [Anaerolineae bacterium]